MAVTLYIIGDVMIYFVPAWYAKDGWQENEQKWYVKRTQTEFDDTVKQVQMFHRNKVQDYKIMLLGYSPNFRHFLHRQSVFHAPYWSCFDAIQEIKRKKVAIISYQNLNWPEDVEFIYTPYVVYAQVQNEKYAQIEFGEDGNMILIDLYKDGQIWRRNYYDDRGFLSSSVVYSKGVPVYRDYLMENGKRKMREHMRDGRVEIHPLYMKYRIETDKEVFEVSFSKQKYASMEELILEVADSYVRTTVPNDLFCIAMHPNHFLLSQVVFRKRKMILSFFEDRLDDKDYQRGVEIFEAAEYLIVDSKGKMDLLCKETECDTLKIMAITPYDTRVDLGISQQLQIQKILVPIDNLEDDAFAHLTCILARFVLWNEKVRVHMLTRDATAGLKRRIQQKISKIINDNSRHIISEQKSVIAQIRKILDAFCVEQCVDEISVSKCMKEQRVVLDVREAPELYLQILSVSMGIPQIVKTATEFVEHRKNGWMVSDFNEIERALDYYLNEIANWNEAVVYAYEISKQYTTEKLLEQWKEVVREIG